MYRDIVAELDDIANTLQARGFNRLAARTDLVTNTLEMAARRMSSRRGAYSRRRSNTGIGGVEGLSMGSNYKGAPPGSDDADEAGHSDQFIAKHYHRVPVGKDSVSRMLGTPSVGDMLNKLDFADESPIKLQASRRRSGKIRFAADEPYNGDPMDPWTTAGLPESGDEKEEPPIDFKQEGDVLPFLGYEEEGTLHMPGGSGRGSEREIANLMDEAEEQNVTSGPGQMGRESRRARNILRAHARRRAEAKSYSPSELLNHSGDPLEDVMSHYPDVDGEADAAPLRSAGRSMRNRRSFYRSRG